MSRKSPTGLARVSHLRSEQAVAAIENEKAVLLAAFHSGELKATFDVYHNYLDLGEFCKRAGLNWNFLNGPKHAKSLKPQIKAFLKDLKRELLVDGIGDPSPTSDVERLEDLLQQAYSQLHAETQRADDAEQQLKELRGKITPRVVRFPV